MKVKWTKLCPPHMGEDDYVPVEFSGTVVGTVKPLLRSVRFIVKTEHGHFDEVPVGECKECE